jgi:hypothetical protein
MQDSLLSGRLHEAPEFPGIQHKAIGILDSCFPNGWRRIEYDADGTTREEVVLLPELHPTPAVSEVMSTIHKMNRVPDKITSDRFIIDFRLTTPLDSQKIETLAKDHWGIVRLAESDIPMSQKWEEWAESWRTALKSFGVDELVWSETPALRDLDSADMAASGIRQLKFRKVDNPQKDYRNPNRPAVGSAEWMAQRPAY